MATERELIADFLSSRVGIKVRDDEWGDDNGTVVALLGRWVARNDGDLWESGENGELTAQVVGSEEYGNERVSVIFTPDGYDRFAGDEVVPFEDVVPLDD